MNELKVKNSLISFRQALDLMLKSDFLVYDKNVKKNSNFKFFDLYHTVMNLKELIRNLSELKRNRENKIYIYVENRYLRSISNLILNEMGHLKNRISIVNSAREVNKFPSGFNIFVILGKVNKKFILETLVNNFSVIHTINDNKFQPVTGIYNICNKISNVNKLLFLFALIDQILKEDNN
jgi:hypothetical protein